MSNIFTRKEKTLLGFGIILIVLYVIGLPILIIFALNTVFITLSIPYTFWTWLSTYILICVLYGKK